MLNSDVVVFEFDLRGNTITLSKQVNQSPRANYWGSNISPIDEADMTIADKETVDLATPKGPMRTYIFRPKADGRYPGLLLYSEIFQVTGPIRRTAAASARLVEALGGKVVGFNFLIELGFLSGREKLTDYEVQALIKY